MITREGDYVLGLRLGTSSLGWAALRTDEHGKLIGLLAVGARKFSPGATGDLDRGLEEPPNQHRQAARRARVTRKRKLARLRALWELLTGAGFLPAEPFHKRDQVIKALDGKTDKAPYTLRAEGLVRPLAPHELGRALYHVAMRRGFQISRRDAARSDEEIGPVKAGIASLAEEIAAAGAPSLGAYLRARPVGEPLRRRWTARSMLRGEFDKLIAVQRPHHPALTDGFARRVAKVVFTQGALKSQRHKVGRCDLEPHRRRALLASLEAQEFRVLCRVNDLRAVDDVDLSPVVLTAEQRAALVALLSKGDATYPQARKAMGLPRTVRFNMERVDEERLVGDRTSARLGKALGDSWIRLSPERRRTLLTDLTTIDADDALARRLSGPAWSFSESEVQAVLATPLEPGHASLSAKAIGRLLPQLRAGVPFATARKAIYPKASTHAGEVPVLPRIDVLYRTLPNPLVRRALSEMRVVVNELVRRHGRPRAVRVCLMRELRVGRAAREKEGARARARARAREGAAAQIVQGLGVVEPKPWMVDKVLLAEECGWVCPHSGRPISIRQLFGETAPVLVRHIIPFSRSLDDSFENKTLCFVDAKSQPGDRLPVNEAVVERYRANAARAAAIAGAKNKPGKKSGKPGKKRPVRTVAAEKLRRVQLSPADISKEYDDEVVAGRFVDACYASRIAVESVARLYPPGRAAVRGVRGSLVRLVREACGLSSVDLPPGSVRTGAIDAVAVALTDERITRRLSAAALSALPGRRRLDPDLVLPWPRFVADVQAAAAACTVSARVRKKVSGALHGETFYRLVTPATESERAVYSVRKHLCSLTESAVDSIHDERLRVAVKAKLAELGEPDPRRAFALPENLPVVGGVRVRAARVLCNDTLFTIGSGGGARRVGADRNHHVEIRMRLRKGGKPYADQDVVSQFEAQRRLRSGEPVVRAGEAPNGLSTLSLTETLDCSAMGKGYQTVRSVSVGNPVWMTAVDDVRKQKEIAAAGGWLRMSVEQLRVKGARKVFITPLGEVRRDGT